jgi:PAS domain S-box-containing protein
VIVGRCFVRRKEAAGVAGNDARTTQNEPQGRASRLEKGLSALSTGTYINASRGTAALAALLAVLSVAGSSLGTTMGLLLSGVSLVVALSGRPRANAISGILALLAGAIAGFSLIDHVLGLGTDFPPHSILPFATMGDAMPPHAAVGILAFGLAQAWTSLLPRRLDVIALFTAGLITSGIGLTTLAGYITGIDAVYKWQDSTAVPPTAALGFWALGSAHLVIARHPQLRISSRLPFTVAALALPAGLFFDLATPPYLGSGFIYVPVVLSAVWFADRRTAFALAAVCSIFTILAYAVKLQHLDEEQHRLIGRMFGVGTDFIVAALIYYFKRVTDENQQVRLRFEALMDNSPDAVVTIDALGTIRQFNPAAERLFGRLEEEVVGQNVKLLMPEPYHSAHDGYLSHHARTGERHIIGTIREVNGRRSDGTVFPLDLSVSELPSDGRKEFVGILRDLTVRKRQEEHLREAVGRLAAYAADLERSNQELDDFAYIASHDLKEPLRGIHNHSRFLLEDYEDRLDDDGKRRLGRLLHLSQRMEKLVNDLLYFSRIGRFELAIKPTDVKAVLRDVISTLDQLLEERNARVMVAEDLPEVVCDSVRVTEVFRNLIVNAIKYNDSAEKIVEIGYLPTHADDDGKDRNKVYFVRDNGKGIASEFHEDIFRIFKRLERADDDAGTGVGLTFVRKIVQRHGGHIWLESEAGSGTVFYFTLAPE